jgi:Family of unknown function (DUF695)
MRNLPARDVRGRYPMLVEIAWGYKSQPNGLPTEEELVFGRTLYAELGKIVGRNGIHAMTRTGDGGRTMYYYVTDPALLRDPIRKYFDAQPPISVRVSVREDLNWERVSEVLDAIKH